jgi:oligosaccharide repeat unit polymerase
MTLPIAVALLAVCSVAMYRYGRSALFPPATLAIVWTITLFALWLCGDLYFPLTAETEEMVLLGVLAFSIGGLLAVRIPAGPGRSLALVPASRRLRVQKMLKWVPLLLIANFPFFLLYLRQLSGTIAPRESMWKQIRIASIKANISGAGGLHIESSLLPFISLAALVAVFEYADTKKDKVHALATLVLACLYQMLNGSRSDLLLLLISAVAIFWVCRGRAPVRALAVAAIAFGLLFGINQVAMGKFGADPGATMTDNLPRVAEGFSTYWLGGIVAFDQILQNPQLKYGWDLNKFITRVANRFGAEMLEHDRNLQYTKVSPTQVTNVYSVFLPYYMQSNSATAVVLLMALVGTVSTYVFRKAIGGTCWAVFAHGAFVFCTIMTIFSDEFFSQITFVLKVGILSTAVYFLPRLTDRVPAPWTSDIGSELCE